MHSKYEFISLYTNPRVIAVLLLGLVSGLPLALVLSTLSVWLTESGVSKTEIGLFAAVTAPYAFKFIWSPLIDQLHLPFFTKNLGRRRGWMILTQSLLMLAIFMLGASSPDINPWNTAIWAFAVSVLSATQDIVIDAYRVEILEEKQQGAGAAVIVLGYRIGMLISGAGALFLAEYAGWFMTYFTMALVMVVGIVTVMLTGEPASSNFKEDGRDFAKWIKQAVVNPFVDFIKTPGWVVVLLFIVFYKFGDAFAGVMTNPFLIEIGFTKPEIATIVKTFGFAAVVAGSFIGGYMIDRFGNLKSLWICGILQMLSNLMFVAQSYAGHNLEFLAATIALENLSGGMGTAAFVAYISGLCNVRYTATQYALFSSLASVGRTFLSTSSGWFAATLGWPFFFVLSTAIAIPGLICLYVLQRVKSNS